MLQGPDTWDRKQCNGLVGSLLLDALKTPLGVIDAVCLDLPGILGALAGSSQVLLQSLNVLVELHVFLLQTFVRRALRDEPMSILLLHSPKC